MWKKQTLCLMATLLLVCEASYAQSIDSVTGKLVNFPSKLLGRIQRKTADLDQQLTRQTEKYLQKMARREERLKKKLYKTDSVTAKNLFANSSQQYSALAQKMKMDTGSRNNLISGEYQPYADSLKVSLDFLQHNPQLLRSSTGANLAGNAVSPVVQAKLQSSVSQLQALQAKMQDADQVKDYIQQRKQQIGDYISQHSSLAGILGKQYQGYNQDVYYYSQQVREYKEMLNDPDKCMRTALQYLNKVPTFSNFMNQHSMLASLFNLPGGTGATPSAATGAATGMPTRDQVMAAFQGQSGVNGTNVQSVVQGNVSSATDQAAQLQDKFSSMGNGGLGNGGGSDLNMPDFTPNGQKTKSFLKRLELGTNLQTVQGTNFFPATSDLGLSLGYKINDNNRIGIGASYKIGWGQNINHIHITGQGASIRSFADFRIKKNIYASGGFEYNYQQPIATLAHLPSLHDWQQSALFGVSRIVSMKTKLFKSVKMQVLWDALSYQQVPKAPPFKFRVGYNF